MIFTPELSLPLGLDISSLGPLPVDLWLATQPLSLGLPSRVSRRASYLHPGGSGKPRVFTLPRRSYWRASYAAPAFLSLRARENREPSLNLLRVPFLMPRTWGSGRQDSLGIDLSVRGVEVRKLFYAAFARGLAKDGYDPEEALQEVYKGLLTRNKGTCPFDVKKSSFGHYVHIVTRCVLANYIRKEKRRLSYESLESGLSLGAISGKSLRSSSGETQFSMDMMPDLHRGSLLPEPGTLGSLTRSLCSLGETSGVTGTPEEIQEALGLLAQGFSKREVALTLGVASPWLEVLLVRSREMLARPLFD